MASTSYVFFILAFAALNVFGLSDYTLAKRVEVSEFLAERSSFIGGWALGGGVTTCPTNTISCAVNDTGGNFQGTCCPSSSTCVPQGLGQGIACCPSCMSHPRDNSATLPFCANIQSSGQLWGNHRLDSSLCRLYMDTLQRHSQIFLLSSGTGRHSSSKRSK